MSDSDEDEVLERKVKITFVGEPSTGKSMLCARYIGGRQATGPAHSTHGAEVLAAECNAVNPPASLQLCDVAGASMHSSMLDNYLYASNIVLLVYDLTNLQSFEMLKNWLDRVRLAFEDTVDRPIYAIFGNKSDLEHQRAVRLYCAQNFALDNNIGNYKGSARTGEAVNNTISTLVSHYLGMPLTIDYVRSHTRQQKAVAATLQTQQSETETKKPEVRQQPLIMNRKAFLIEKYTDNVRFCIICNYLGKIIPALQSRCTRFRFAPLKPKQIVPRLEEVARLEGVKLSEDGVKALLALSGGDMRKVLNTLQSTWLAYKDVNEDNVYTCVGHPLRSDIANIVNWLLNENVFSACFKRIQDLKIAKGLALSDILTEVHTYIHRMELPSEVLVALLMKMSDMEHRLSSGCDESIELAALISTFYLNKELIKLDE